MPVVASEVTPMATEAGALPLAGPLSGRRGAGPSAMGLPGLSANAAPMDSPQTYSAFAPDTAYASPAAASATGLAPGPGGAALAQAGPGPSAPPFEDLSDRIARDLRRRLAVERERQGSPRWKS
jgi:hypothetical protein